MLQEIFDKIVVLVTFFLLSESVRPFTENAAEDVAADRDGDLHGTNGGTSSTVIIETRKPATSERQRSAQATVTDNETRSLIIESGEAQSGEENKDLRANNNQGDGARQSTQYGTIAQPQDEQSSNQRALFRSCKTSLGITFTLTIAIIPANLFMITVLYLDVHTSSTCSQQNLNNNSLPREVMKYVIIGHDVEAVALNIWFQSMLILLFGWKRFKRYHSSTILLGVLLGLMVVLFKTTLFLVGIDFTRTYYRYPGNALFLFGVIYTSHLVAKKICRTSSSVTTCLKKLHVFAILSTQYFWGFLIAMAYRYIFVPWFRNAESSVEEATIALITPTLIIVPVMICENLALKSLAFQTNEGRIFVLVYFVNGVSLFLYCIMQAGVKDLSTFILLSVFRGALQVFQTATVKIRHKIFVRIWQCLQRRCSCLRLGELRDESDEHRRLRVDKEIQVMLYQSTAIILSQAYLVLYVTSNYNVHTVNIIREFIITRVSIGIGISILANYLSILIHIHWCNTQLLTKVWYKNWKHHVLALTLCGVMSICYFTGVLLSVFENFARSEKYHIKDCTAPFH